MKHWFLKWNKFFLKNSMWFNIVIFYSFSYVIVIVGLPGFLLLDEIIGENNSGPDIKGWVGFFAAVIVAPLFETWLCQYLIFRIGKKFKIQNGWILLMSAIWFGVNHLYSPQYIWFGFLLGLVFGYGYYLYKSVPSKAFWFVTGIHLLHNLTSFIIVTFAE
ncbi:hypothetical protein Runsl_4045 [Runella slithyformis DSM 19594]|uniref:CAAX prenyl protease 2/Lysostaphin resistance protein A-like domain-containing protein n=2 Tax=Runella TaxID=105 RepID=A0A7U4E783_RUNSL|nr:hypothetical protein Runsl_4045 [Runella slithyformis DSM 19594]